MQIFALRLCLYILLVMSCKRKESDTLLGFAAKAPKLSVRRLEEILKSSASPQGDQHFCRELEKSLDINTPCGKLLVRVPLPMLDGPDYMWLVCNPFAFLYLRCQRSVGFARFLFRHLKESENKLKGSIALYSDESAHGNQLRHDSVNELQCIYWAVCQLPSWFRVRKHGWFYFGFLHTTVQHNVRGDLSGLMKLTMNRFYQQGGFNFQVGFFLPIGDTGSRQLVQLDFECMVQDEKAHKGVSSVKGAAGWRCCLRCTNVWNVLDKTTLSNGNHHFAHAVPSQFKVHTRDTFFKAVDEVSRQREVLNKTKFEKLQKENGVTWCPDGLVMDTYMRKHFCPPLNTYWDPMHCLLASSGVSQYEVNGFCHACVSIGVAPEMLDEFSNRVVWPKGRRMELPKLFFQKRMAKAGGHIRAFAAEVLSAVTVLVWFFKLVLQPKKRLTDHGHCIQLLAAIHCILFSLGDKAVPLADLLDSLMIVHHHLYLKIYGEDMAKPKFHYCYHLGECLRLFGVNLNCFKMERMHSFAMQVAAHLAAHQEGYILRRVIKSALDDFEDNDFKEVYLVKPKPRPDLQDCFRPLVPDIGTNVFASDEICCGDMGHVCAGHLVVVRSGASGFRLGKAEFFVSCSVLASTEVHFFVGAAMFRQNTVVELEWSPVGGGVQFANCSDMKFVVPFVHAGHDSVIPLLPNEEIMDARLA
jgi:hypothetical protein